MRIAHVQVRAAVPGIAATMLASPNATLRNARRCQRSAVTTARTGPATAHAQPRGRLCLLAIAVTATLAQSACGAAAPPVGTAQSRQPAAIQQRIAAVERVESGEWLTLDALAASCPPPTDTTEDARAEWFERCELGGTAACRIGGRLHSCTAACRAPSLRSAARHRARGSRGRNDARHGHEGRRWRRRLSCLSLARATAAANSSAPMTRGIATGRRLS